jgi:hypothetical protein
MFGDESESRRRAMETRVLTELGGGLWHSTHKDRFKLILASGAILPEPEIPNRERWKTSMGEHYYPYVRTLGGVSLFDFSGFDRARYSEECPLSTWWEFVPFRREWGHAVWIEIDRGQVAPNFISGVDIVARWKSDAAYRHTIMPYIEAAHLGSIPRRAFKRAFLVRDGNEPPEALDC